MEEIINEEILNKKEYLTVRDMMKTFNISENTVYRWIHTVQLPEPTKFRQKNYWKSEDIREWFNKQFHQTEEV